MKTMEQLFNPIITYYTDLEKSGVQLSPADKEHLERARRIIAVAVLARQPKEDGDYYWGSLTRLPIGNVTWWG